MTFGISPVKLLILVSIVVPLMAQEASLVNPAGLAATLTSPSTNIAVTPLTQDRDRASARTLYRWSVATVLAANAADVASSWSSREANPLVAGPTNQFGATSMAIKSGFVGASLLMQHFVLRHRPEAAKRLAWMNFISSGVLGGIAAHNMSLR